MRSGIQRLVEGAADAEARRAKQALEVAVDAGELGTFHCPFPLHDIDGNTLSQPYSTTLIA